MSLLARIETFLAQARLPAVLEPGEAPLALKAGSFVLTPQSAALKLECWSETRNLVRKLSRLTADRKDRLEFETERFGQKAGKLLILDLAQPRAAQDLRHGSRLEYREVLRRSLRRQFPSWRLAEISTEPDLEHSLSPAYTRAFLRRGNQGVAVIGAGPLALDPAGAVTFGLIWLDYLRRRESGVFIRELALFAPAGIEAGLCHRVRYLHPEAAQYSVFVQTPDGLEDRVEPRDYTNLDTQLRPLLSPDLRTFDALPGQCHAHVDGTVSFRVHGLEYARLVNGTLLYGLHDKTPAREPRQWQEAERLGEGIARYRHPEAADRTHPLYAGHPEAWLESQLRASVQTLDPTLLPAPVYTQAPHLAGGERGIVDLLAVDRDGRLTVIEVKAAQEVHLPLQALDYWMRVQWHLERGEFTQRGYFPGIPLQRVPPRLLLVAPSLEIHPSAETLLRYLAPEVDAETLGIGLQWRQKPLVVFRAPRKPWPLQSSVKYGTRSGI